MSCTQWSMSNAIWYNSFVCSTLMPRKQTLKKKVCSVFWLIYVGSSWFCTQLATVIIYNFMLHHKFLFHILFFDNLLATWLLYMPFISSNRDVFLIPLRKRRCSQFDVDSEHPKRAITLQLIPTHGKALKWRRKHPLDEVSDSRNAWQNVIVSKFTQI